MIHRKSDIAKRIIKPSEIKRKQPYDHKWNKKSKEVIKKQIVCAAIYCYEFVTDVDHIIPIAKGGSDDISNRIGYCRYHHMLKTAIEDRVGIQKRKYLGMFLKPNELKIIVASHDTDNGIITGRTIQAGLNAVDKLGFYVRMGTHIPAVIEKKDDSYLIIDLEDEAVKNNSMTFYLD